MMVCLDSITNSSIIFFIINIILKYFYKLLYLINNEPFNKLFKKMLFINLLKFFFLNFEFSSEVKIFF